MHIPDGFLDGPTSVATAVAATAAVGYGLRRARLELDDRRAPLLGVTAAFIFAAQMLNFPIAGGTSGHFLGAALAAILLGPWLACVTMAVVVGTQALLFADGGVTALGANVLNMGVVGALAVGLCVRPLLRRLPAGGPAHLAAVGVAAFVAVELGALATALELGVSGTVPLAVVLPAMLGVHVLIGVGEAVVTVAAVAAVVAARRDLLDGAAVEHAAHLASPIGA